jgi:MFS family permease
MDTTLTAEPSAKPPPSRRLGLGRDFNLLWTGTSVSFVGAEITALALPLLAVYTLDAGPTTLGLLGSATWVPYVLFALLAGAWGDRIRRRRVLIAADLVRGVLLGAVVVLALTGTLSVPLLLGLAFLVGVGNVFFEVFYYSYVPTLVDREALLGANSRLQASESTAQVAGPGVSGLLVQFLGAPLAVLADAVSFLFSGAMLSRIRKAEPVPEATDDGPIFRQIRAGISLTWRNRILLTLVGTAAICNLTAQWIIVLFPLFCVQMLHLDAGLIGLIISTGAIGSLLGSAACGAITKRLGIGQASLWTLFGECVGFLLMPFAPADNDWVAVPMLIAGWFIVGFSAAVSRIISISVRQTVTPQNFLGRVNATHRFVSYGVVAVGTLAGGVLASAAGLRLAMVIAAVVMFASVGAILVSPLLRIREIDAHDAAAPVEPTEPAPGAITPPADRPRNGTEPHHRKEGA